MRRADPALGPGLVGVGLACGGWAAGNTVLAFTGVLVALTAALMWAWGRWCLAGVSYVRTLDHRRAAFGEQVGMEVDLVNDKLLPVAWLHVRDSVPSALPIEGATRGELVTVLAMLPYQRVRRRLVVTCAERGLHRFGPAMLRSGSPLGSHEQRVEVMAEETLLVYPKVVPLSATPITSRVPIDQRRVRRSITVDPTRVLGVRTYATGDPVRSIDWRATARSGDLLVRVHEPAATPSVAVFADLLPPPGVGRRAGADLTELVVSVAASAVSQLLGEGVPTGLSTSGTSRGAPIAMPPSRRPAAGAIMLELLAQVTPVGGVPIADALVRTRAASVLVIAADFPASTCAALAHVRRRCAIGALWVSHERAGGPPPRPLVDACWHVAAEEGWRDWAMLELR